MKIVCFMACGLILAGVSSAQPVVNPGGVVNAASFSSAGLPNAAIAQGSIFTVFGTGLGPGTIQYATFPLPAQLAGTSVQVTVGGSAVNAPMIFTVAGQVAAILPSKTPAGAGTLTVTFQGATSAAVAVQVIASNFGIFARNTQGSGPAVVQNFISDSMTPYNSVAAPAKPGQVEILWGTGLGPINGDDSGLPPTGNLPVNVQVMVGGKSAAIQYQGRTGCCAGEDQINFVVPDGVLGCYVPVAVVVNGVVSNFTTMSISLDGSTCSDPAGFSVQDIDRVGGGQDLKTGVIVLSRLSPTFTVGPVSVAVNEDLGSAFFYDVNSTALFSSAGVLTVSSFGSCTVFTCQGGILGGQCVPEQQPVKALGLKGLDAGTPLSITRTADNTTVQVPEGATGFYAAQIGGGGIQGINISGALPDFLNPGNFMVSGPGGTNVGAFSTTLAVAPNLTWTNQAATASITRSQGLTVQWTGGDPNGYVLIVGTSTANSPEVTATFACAVKTSLGQFTIPAWVLSALPASGTLTLPGTPINVDYGFLLVGAYPTVMRFAAPGLDAGFASTLYLTGKNVPYL